MPFWKKKEPEIPQPHVEPGMSAPQSSEPNPIRFSDEPQFGTCLLYTSPSPRD